MGCVLRYLSGQGGWSIGSGTGARASGARNIPPGGPPRALVSSPGVYPSIFGMMILGVEMAGLFVSLVYI